MRSTKLVKVIGLLGSEELRMVQKALKSPFFSGNKNMRILFQSIRKYHPSYDHASLSKEKLFAKVFSNIKYSDVKIRNLMGELSQLIEDCLIFYQIKSDTSLRRRELASVYLRKNQTFLFEKEFNKIQKELTASTIRDVEHYQLLYKQTSNRLESLRAENVNEQLEFLQEKDRNLELFYQLSKIQLESELRSSRNIISVADKKSSEWAKKHLENENIVYQLFQKTIELHVGKQEKVFEELKHFFVENIEKLALGYKQIFFLHLINFAIGKMKEDDKRYNPVVVELYLLSLEHNAILVKGLIRFVDFFNIVTTAIKEKGSEWGMQFVKDYASFLDEVEREDTIALSQIIIYSYSRQFAKAISLYSQSNFSDIQKHLAVRTQAIRCYFELFIKDDSYFNLLEDQTYAFEKFIRRSETIEETYKEACFYFLQMVRKIAKEKLKGGLNEEKKKRLLIALKEQKIVVSRSWLIEKIET